MKKLAIIVTHPIQYYVPVYKQLAKNCDLIVFYTWGVDGANEKFDPDFKQTIKWDLPLLDGYKYELLKNTAKNKGSHHFNGIVNPDLNQRIIQHQPDAILVYGWAYQSHLKAIRHFKNKIPIWFRGDSTLLNKNTGFKSMAKTLFLKWVYKHIDTAFYVGTANKAYFKKYGLKEKQLIFAPHAVENERFALDRSLESENLRKSLNISDTDILILFAGKFETNKNPLSLLNAFIQMNCKNVHLLFVGNGELQNQLIEKKDASTALGKPNVHFIDFQNQNQMPVVYQACDLFCLPSQSETWGLAVNEAMACAKAILVSDQVGCAKDLVIDGENGLIFKSDNQHSLITALSVLLKSKAKLTEMGIKSATHIKNWSIAKQSAIILNELAYR